MAMLPPPPTDEEVVLRRIEAREGRTNTSESSARRVAEAHMAFLSAIEAELFAKSDGGEGAADASRAREAAYERVLWEVSQLRAAGNRNRKIVGRCALESAESAARHAQIDAKVAEIRTDIENLQRRLDEARLERRNKEEYETLARVINTHASRSQLAVDRVKLEEELSSVEAAAAACDAELATRTRQTALLLRSVHDLRTAFGEDEASAEARADAGGEAGSDDEEGRVRDGDAEGRHSAKGDVDMD